MEVTIINVNNSVLTRRVIGRITSLGIEPIILQKKD